MANDDLPQGFKRMVCEIVVPEDYDPADLLENVQDLAREIVESHEVSDDDSVFWQGVTDLCSVQEGA